MSCLKIDIVDLNLEIIRQDLRPFEHRYMVDSGSFLIMSGLGMSLIYERWSVQGLNTAKPCE